VEAETFEEDDFFAGLDDPWTRRQSIPYRGSIALAVPSIDDLILTKQWAMRDKDIADIRLLEGLKRQRGA